MKKEQKIILEDGWEVYALVDDDGHLSLFINNADNSKVYRMRQDIVSNNQEWGDRFTTVDLEKYYRAFI